MSHTNRKSIVFPATLSAALAASLVGSLALVLVIVSYSNSKVEGQPVLGASIFFAFAFFYSLMITIPVSIMAAITVRPALRRFNLENHIAYSVAGFLVGAGVWPLLALLANNAYPTGTLLEAAAIGGPAGLSAGFVFWWRISGGQEQ